MMSEITRSNTSRYSRVGTAVLAPAASMYRTPVPNRKERHDFTTVASGNALTVARLRAGGIVLTQPFGSSTNSAHLQGGPLRSKERSANGCTDGKDKDRWNPSDQERSGAQ